MVVAAHLAKVTVREISPQQLQELLSSQPDTLLVDVRQPEEHELVKLAGSTLIPLDQLAERFSELERIFNSTSADVVVYCRSGGRSGKACEWLAAQGIKNAVNLVGGINLYAEEIDQTLTPY